MSQIVVSPYRKRTASTAFPKSYQAALARKRQRRAAPMAGPIVRKKASRGDVKLCDVSGLGIGLDYTGLISNALNTLTHGDGSLNQFNGNSITPVNWTFTYEITLGTAGSTNTVRVMMFQWDSSNVVTTAGILQSVGNANAPFSPKNANVYPNIRVLSDKLYTVHDNQPIVCDKIFIKGKKMTPVDFVPTGTSINKGALYVLAISDDGLTAYPQFRGYSRVSFTD